MKNTLKVFGIIAIIAVIGFSMITCNKSGGSSGSDSSKSSGGGGKTLNSPEALKEYLDKQPANSPDKPIKVSMTINDPMFKSVANVIKSSGKYISLNITGNALTTIPKEAFKECETLVNITIPDSVTSIENGAFSGCFNLDSVTIPNNVTEIGYRAFSQCKSITRVIIPSSVTDIGDMNFDFVTNVTFQGSTIEFFGYHAFGINGDLRDKYLAGGKGTYIVTGKNEYAGPVWTKQ